MWWGDRGHSRDKEQLMQRHGDRSVPEPIGERECRLERGNNAPSSGRACREQDDT